jgi:NADH dehydrogenase
MIQQRIAVLGGSGFVGRRLVQALAERGHEVSVFSRNLAAHHERMLPPGVRLRQLDVYDEAALASALAGMDVAINLVGILNERGNDGSGFRRAHVELTQGLIRACHAAGVRRLLQMSSLNAGRGSSHYLISRGEAEAAVRASGLHWTVFEPSVIFGAGDGLFCRFAALLQNLPVLPLARADARFAPVHVGDVVEAFLRCLDNPASHGETYELYGPEIYSLREIVQLTARQLGLRRMVIALPDALGRLQALACDFVPGKPFSSDNFRSLLTDSVGGIDGLHRLGIEPARVSRLIASILGHGDDRQTRLARYRSSR